MKISSNTTSPSKDPISSQLDREKETKKHDLEKAAKDFESIFLNLVVQSMSKTVEKSGYINGGNAEDIYRSLLDQEYAKSLSEQNMTGLSQSIVKQWEKYLY